MINAQRLKYPVPLMCHIFKVSPSGYYQWCKRPNLAKHEKETRLKAEILAAHKRTRETFGPERLQHDLAAHGVKANQIVKDYTIQGWTMDVERLINGGTLPSLKKDDENWKVRLIEEEFHKKMWEVGE